MIRKMGFVIKCLVLRHVKSCRFLALNLSWLRYHFILAITACCTSIVVMVLLSYLCGKHFTTVFFAQLPLHSPNRTDHSETGLNMYLCVLKIYVKM